MGNTKQFEDLDVWQKAKEFSVHIYSLTKGNSFDRDFSFRDQLRRASISIISNIAEGFERNGNKEFIQFLSIAKGSAGEIRAQLEVAKSLGYIVDADHIELKKEIVAISKMLAGFINYLKDSDLKGSKYVQEPFAEYYKPPQTLNLEL